MSTFISQKSYTLYQSITERIKNFPKPDRYTLGIRIENTCLSLIEAIITAEQTVPVLKDRSLLEANIKTETLKIFIRMAMEKKIICETNYFTWSEQLIEIGKMIGGWKKSLTRPRGEHPYCSNDSRDDRC